MNIRRYLNYWDWFLLAGVTAVGLVLTNRADNQFDMLTRYHPGWVYSVGFFVPLLTTIYFSWKYRLFDQSKFIGSIPVVVGLVSFLFLMDALPRLVLLANVPNSTSPPVLQELAVNYVNKQYAKTTYIGSTIGIRYGGEVLRFESSRTKFFLLQRKKRIRAEIGQAVPGFYYIRNLQLASGEREQARADYWGFFWQSGEGIFVVGGLSIGLVCWVLSVWLQKRKKIHQ